MLNRSFFVVIALIASFLCTSAGAKEELGHGDRLFLEIWNDNSYRKTEFGTDEPGYTEEDYYISQLWLQTGLRYALSENVFFDPHLTFEMSGDWGSEPWNRVYWNNSIYWGVGARISYELSPDEDEDATIWLSDFNLEFFGDWMFSGDSPDNGKDEIPDENETDNLRTGI